jgi:hypothetical protein
MRIIKEKKVRNRNSGYGNSRRDLLPIGKIQIKTKKKCRRHFQLYI